MGVERREVAAEAAIVSEDSRRQHAGKAMSVATLLREKIVEGRIAPGAKLSEERLSRTLEVSRNTLRESFHLLAKQRLLMHRFSQGTFVRVLSIGDIVDIFRVQRVVECAVLESLDTPLNSIDGVESAVAAAESSASLGIWHECSAAESRFHRAIAALAGSARVDAMICETLTELQLALHCINDLRRLHEPYVERKRKILSALAAGDASFAARLLFCYLEDFRRQLVEQYSTDAAGES
ncbi:GntR family transcriptional regulator [Streptomyces sp. NRAIS4]